MKKVISQDGTHIAYERIGEGPALIYITGALCHRSFSPVAETARVLSSRFSVFSYDRRGRGGSGDTEPYAVAREVEDIESLIDEAGGSAYLYGHSSGAALALEAALSLGSKVRKVAMYEAPYNVDDEAFQESKVFDEQLKSLLKANRRGEAVAFFMQGVGMPEEVVGGIKLSPDWPKLEALAHTIAYDLSIVAGVLPLERAANLTTPTLLMYGEASFPFMREVAQALAKAIPDAELCALKGQGHDVDTGVLLPLLADFFN